jgi:hypothetical protein
LLEITALSFRAVTKEASVEGTGEKGKRNVVSSKGMSRFFSSFINKGPKN